MIATITAITLGVHLASIHTPDHGQNNTNPGIYAIVDGWAAGVYRNSYKRTSAYFGYVVNAWGPIDITVGAVTGYKKDPVTGYGWSSGNVAPMLVPSMRLGYARVFVIPQVQKKASWVFHLAIEKEF
jgi:hypothetical protein